jgi:hypothetical protein
VKSRGTHRYWLLIFKIETNFIILFLLLKNWVFSIEVLLRETLNGRGVVGGGPCSLYFFVILRWYIYSLQVYDS